MRVDVHDCASPPEPGTLHEAEQASAGDDGDGSSRAAALSCISRGWAVVTFETRTKGPRYKDWQNQIVTAPTIDDYFGRRPKNIGVLMGPKSGGLVDIDLDCREAVTVANYLLPITPAIFGRLSNRASHRLYISRDMADQAGKAAVQFTDMAVAKLKEAGSIPKDSKAMILEIRCGGGGKVAQTVFPGSVHVDGEHIEWEPGCNGEPAKVDAGVLLRCAAEVAGAVLVARYMPAIGARHDYYLTLGGFLARCGFTLSRARLFAEATAKAGGANIHDAVRCVEDVYKNHSTGGKIRGYPALKETLGDLTAQSVATWLGFNELREEDAAHAAGAPRDAFFTGTRPTPLAPAVAPITATPFAWKDPSSIPRRAAIYGRHYIRKFVSMTFAHGGVGKSSLSIGEVLAISTGRPLLGVHSDERVNVWLWNGEDPMEELERRVMAACIHHDVTSEEIEGRLFIDTGREQRIIIAEQGKSGVLVAHAVVEAVVATIRKNEIGLLIIDPFVSCHRVSENDNGAIEAVAAEWAGIADATGSAIEFVHHTRKANNSESTVEDGRGASALLAKARSARVLNAMTRDEAEKAGVENRRLHFRVENGKSNMFLPADKADWYRMASVDLGNGWGTSVGDNVGVCDAWVWPDPLANITVRHLRVAQSAVANGGPWREHSAAKDWVGKAIAQALKMDIDNRADKTKLVAMLKIWTANGMFKVVDGVDKARNTRKFVEVGEWATD